MTADDTGTSPEKMFLITGANSGLGLATARNIAAASAANAVIVASRDPARGEDARQAIIRSTGNERVRAMTLDLASLASVRQFAADVDASLDRPIDALVLNAGIPRGPRETIDGFDGVFETNHLGHFLLTQLLLDRMSPAGRIIAVSSDMHQPPGPKLRWPGAAELAKPGSRRIAPQLRYSYSKLCNLYFAYELSRRLRSRQLGASTSDISVAAFNPGLMTDTNFASMPGPIAPVMKRIFASRVGSLDTSAAALAELATAESGSATDIDGLYFDRTAAHARRSSELSYNIRNALDLWELSAQLCT